MSVRVTPVGWLITTPPRFRAVPTPPEEILANRALPASATVSVPEGLTATATGFDSVIPETATGVAWPLISESCTIWLLPASAI